MGGLGGRAPLRQANFCFRLRLVAPVLMACPQMMEKDQPDQSCQSEQQHLVGVGFRTGLLPILFQALRLARLAGRLAGILILIQIQMAWTVLLTWQRRPVAPGQPVKQSVLGLLRRW